MEKGKLIVLEGIDGSGKSSQYRKICDKLKRDGISFHHIVFPRYEKDSSSLIRMYLGGEFGSKPEDVNAYTASTFYAVDRFASFKEDWGKIYANGGLIIADRYTTSNAVHQGSKLPEEERAEFYSWLEDLEYNKMQLPKPDLVIYLDVDLETSMRRTRKRRERTGASEDIHEVNPSYLQNCISSANQAADHYGWTRVPFMKDGVERDAEEKNIQIYQIIRECLK